MNGKTFLNGAWALVFTVGVVQSSWAGNVYVNDFGDAGWLSDDTRDNAGKNLIGGPSNANPGITHAPAVNSANSLFDAESAIRNQISWGNSIYGTRGNLGFVSLNTTAASGANLMKSTLSVVDAAGIDNVASAFGSDFSASYEWVVAPDADPTKVALKFGIQSSQWAASQTGFDSTRSGESAWDMVLVYVPNGTPVAGGNYLSSVTLTSTSGQWSLFKQAGNNYFGAAALLKDFGAASLEQVLADPTWGALISGGTISSVQFGVGSGTTDMNFSGGLDWARVSFLNDGDLMDFVDASFWVNPAGGGLLDPANWNGAVPSPTQNGVFALDDSYTVSVGSNANVSNLGVGNGDVTIQVANGVSLNLLNNGFLSVEQGAELTVAGPGSVNGSTLEVWGDATILTEVNLGGGSVNQPDRNGRYALVIGPGGNLVLGSGAVVNLVNPDATPVLRVGEKVGIDDGLGTLTVEAGAALNVGLAGKAGTFQVGDWGGTGKLIQTGGTISATGSMNIGNQGGTGTYDFSGGSLIFGNGLGAEGGGNFIVGRSDNLSRVSTGIVNISGSADLHFYENAGATTKFFIGGTPEIAASANSTGTVNQTGGVVTVENGVYFSFGYGNGTYNLDGGVLKVGGVDGIRKTNGATYAFNLGGGTLEIYGSDLTTSVLLTLVDGTVSTFDTMGYGANLSAFGGPGAFVKTGEGTLTLSGVSSIGKVDTLTYVPAVSVVEEGTLAITGNTTVLGILAAAGWETEFDNPNTATISLSGGAALTIGDASSPGSYLLVGYDGSGMGYGDTGAFSMTGGTLTVLGVTDAPFPGSGISVGDNNGTGRFTMTGGTIDLADAGNITNLSVGTSGGTGTFIQSGGTVNLGTNLTVGAGVGSVGSYQLSGNAVLNAQPASGSTIIYVGDNGATGTVLVSGNADVNFGANAGLWIGGIGSAANNGSIGTFTQTGGTVDFLGNIFQLGGRAGDTGTYNLNGGTLAIGNHLTISEGDGTGILNLGGGTLKALTDFSTDADLAVALVGSGSTIDTGANSITIRSGFGGTGGFSKVGAGRLILEGNTLLQGDSTVRGLLQIGSGSGRTGIFTAESDLVVKVESFVSRIQVGVNAGNGTFTLGSGASIAIDDSAASGGWGTLDVGRGAGSVGVFNQTGGTVALSGGAWQIGYEGGTGTYNLSGNASVTSGAGSSFFFGSGANAKATLNVGDNSKVTLAAQSFIGSGVGGTSNTSATINQTGAGSTVTFQGPVAAFGTVSDEGGATPGTAVYNLQAGTLNFLNVNDAGTYGVRFGDGGSGTLNQTGGTLNVTNSAFVIGRTGTGAYNLSSGTANFANTLNVAVVSGSTGTVTQTGGTLSINAGQLAFGAGNGTYSLNGGTLALGGTNGIQAGSGTATFNLGGGTLKVIGSNLTTSIAANLTASSTIDTNGLNATLSGALGGTGGLVKAGNGTLTLANVSYAGNTSITGGTLEFTGDTAGLNGNIVNNGGLLFNQSADSSFGGNITGSGSVTKNGAGKLTLSGDNAYAGGTFILGGQIIFADLGALPGNVNVSAPGKLVFGTNADGTYNGVISGNGGVIDNADGTLTFTAIQQYTGGTEINEIALQATTQILAASSAITLGATGQLIFNQNTDGVYNGSILGLGNLIKAGSGKVTLGGFLADFGTIFVQQGALEFTSGTSLLADIANSGTVIFNQATDSTYGSEISLTGSVVKTGAGTLTLDWVNSYTGTTSILGGTLKLGVNLALGSGALIINGGTLDLNGNSDVIEDAITLVNGSIIGGAGSQISSTVGFVVQSGSVDAVLSGAVGLAKSGSGTVNLKQVNTYTGGTTVNAGTLAAGINDAISGALTLNGGTFALGTHSVGLDTVTLNGGTISGPGTLGVTTALNVSNGAIFAALSGAAPLTKSGAGTVVLSGNNAAFTGPTSITGGTLQTTVANALGGGGVSVGSGATLFASSPLNVGGPLSVNSANLKVGTVSSTSANLSVTGDFTVSGAGNAFILANGVSSPGTYKLVEVGGTATNPTDFTVNLGGSGSHFISGATLAFDGGFLNLTIANNAVATGTEIAGNLPFVIFLPNGPNVVIAPGSVIGGLTLNTQTTTFTGGSLTVNTGNFDTGGFDAIFSNSAVTIAGDLNKAGSGALVINNLFTVNGDANVGQGVLQVEGVLSANQLNLAPGALLKGSGVINGSLFVAGTLAPGSSPGTLTINGNLSLAPISTTQIEIESLSVFDRIVVSGLATLGGTLEVIPFGGNELEYGQSFNFLSAGDVSGAFDAVAMPEGFRGRILIEGGEVTLVAAPSSYTLVARNQNQFNVAAALDGYIAASSGDRLAVSTALDQLSAAQYPAAFEQISPAFYQSLTSTTIEQYNAQGQFLQQRFSAVALGRQAGFAQYGTQAPVLTEKAGKAVASAKDIVEATPDNRWGIWTLGNGIFARSSIASIPNYRSDSGGFLVGGDYRWSETLVTGVFGGYQGTASRYANGGRTTINAARFGAYAAYDSGSGFYANTVVGGGYSAYDVKRPIQFGSINRAASSAPGGAEFVSQLATGYDWKAGGFTFGPLGSLQYTYAGVGGFGENGAESLNLRVGQQNANSLRTTLGARAAYTWVVNEKIAIIPEVRMSWQHEFLMNPTGMSAALDGGSGPGFGYTTTAPARDAVFAGAGVTLQVGDRWNANVYYNADFGRSDYTGQMISGGLGISF